jgi:dihydrofolate synthase/folylpolyglutamate synthase
VNDKDLEEILPLFPKNAIYFSKPNNPRGLDATMKSKSKRPDRNSIQLNYSGLPKAIETSKDTDFIYIIGSTFVVAEIL